MTVRDELQARALYQQRYGTTAAPLLREIERRVIGGNRGANGCWSRPPPSSSGRPSGRPCWPPSTLGCCAAPWCLHDENEPQD
jgi:hypothetical protein